MIRIVARAESVLIPMLALLAASCAASPPRTNNAVQTALELEPIQAESRVVEGTSAPCFTREIYFPEPFEPDPATQSLSPAVRSMQASIECVRAQLAGARQARNMARAQCLNDKLNQLSFAQRNWDARVDKFNRALDQQALYVAAQEYATLRALSERTRSVANQVESCLGSTDVIMASVDDDKP